MARKLLWMSAAALALAAATGCQKNAEEARPAAAKSPEAQVALVPEAERSRHFAAVNRQLELGGTLYGYVDIDGDALRLADALRGMVDNVAETQPQAALLKQDYRQIFTDLGLADVKAIGLSSVAEAGGGFRNRCFLYTPEGRHGLLAGLGGPATPFQHLQLAPADADLFFETEMDLAAVYTALRSVVTRVAGEATASLVETQLKKAGNPAGFSALDLIQRWKGRTTCVLRFDETGAITLPTSQPVKIPAFALLLRFDGIAPALKPVLDQIPAFARSEEGGAAIYALQAQLPIATWKPLLVIEGDALFIATSREFFDACRTTGPRLAQNPAFAATLARVGQEGNGLSYISPRFFARLRQLPELNAQGAPELSRALALGVRNLPETTQPLIALRTNLPDGILFRSLWASSLKQDLAMVAVYNPVTVGALAAMAIPAFEKVRASSNEKTIQNNLRQLSVAAEQHYLETGRSSATFDDLVGEGRYIRELKPVAGENYRSIIFKQGYPVRVRLPDGRTFEQKP